MKRIKKIVIGLLLCGGMVAPCFSVNENYKACTSLFRGQTAQDLDYESIAYAGGNKTVKNLIQNFCSNVANLKCIDSSDGGYVPDYFDASQSTFLAVLCNSVNFGDDYIQTSNILKEKSFLDFGIVQSETGYLEPCHRSHSMDDCNFAYYLPQIFNKIENDFFNIRQARFLGIDGLSESFSAENAANNFSKGVFPGLIMQKGLEEGICDKNSTYYKSTCKVLKNYMVDAENLLKNTKVVNIETLQELAESADCDNNPDLNILYCGLLGTNSEYRFLNTVYNEYFWYNVFLGYYSFYLNGYDFLSEGEGDIDDRLEENIERISLIQDQISKSRQAITLSLRSLTEMTYSFPTHIGFLMYQEDAKYFMENTSKLYTPIRTLYDKLRNVQIKES